jgi:mRNA-degrading endonuclease toxin of MazEF toxin-antitoxin module
MNFERGDVVWGPDPFRSGESPRPWLILNNAEHPFAGEEYVVAALTTTDRPEALAASGEWVTGEPTRESYVSPWTVNTLKHADVVEPQGNVTETFVQRVVARLNRYLDAPE